MLSGVRICFLRLSNIPLYVLFIHSSVDEHLYGSYLLAIVNNAAMNIGRQIFEFLFSVILGIYYNLVL